MSGWLLDADVLSQPAKKTGDSRAIAWIEAQQDHCDTSLVTAFSESTSQD